MKEENKYVGITFDKKSARTPLWRVRVYKNQRVYFVGRFKEKEEALLAKEKFLEKLETVTETQPISSDIPPASSPAKTSTVN
jgi:hypothetical protein